MFKKLTLSATMFLVIMAVVASQGFATAPTFSDKLPSETLLYVRGAIADQDDWEFDTNAFDLDDFVTDVDTDPSAIEYADPTVASSDLRGTGSVDLNALAALYTPPSVQSDNSVDVFAFNYTGTLTLQYTADDLVDAVASTLADVHYSSFRIRTPRVGLDNRIAGSVVDIPYTWVIAGSAMTSSAGLLDLSNLDTVTVGGGISGSPIVSGGVNPLFDIQTYDVEGNPVNVDSTLDISIVSTDPLDADYGKFSIIPILDANGKPLQQNPVIVSYLVGDPSGNSDWSGASTLVAPALTPGSSIRVQDFSGFEGFADGATISTDVDNGENGWAIVPGKTSGQHQIITAGYPTPWAGAASGNVLKVTIGSGSGAQVRIISMPITPIEPGATYGLTMNLATNEDDSSTTTPRVFLRAKGVPSGDNTSGLKVGKSGMPTIGDGWMQLFTTYTAPLMHAEVPGADGSGEYSFHYQGVQLFLQFAAFPAGGDTSIFVDNVYFYKISGAAAEIDEEGTSDVDLSVGKTAMDMTLLANASATPTDVQGDFEGGTTLADVGWEFTEDAANSTYSLSAAGIQPKSAPAGQVGVIGTYRLEQAVDHTGMASSSNCFAIKLDGASGRENASTPENYGVRYALRGVYDAGVAPGAAVYTARCFVQSNASSMPDVPVCVFGMTNVGDGQFDTLATTVVQGAGVPVGTANINGAGVWRRIQVTGTFINTGDSPLQPLAVYFQAVALLNAAGNTAVAVGAYANDPVLGTAGAGYDDRSELSPNLGDADVYFDDVSIEQVNMKSEYYDADLLMDEF
jgi:hypothetical protein